MQRRDHAEYANRPPLPIIRPYYSDAAQRKSSADNQVVHEAGTRQESNTGLPSHLKSGIETLSGADQKRATLQKGSNGRNASRPD